MDLTKLSDADLAALQTGKLADMTDEGLAHLSSAPVAPSARGSILDAPNALASGFDRGLVRYAGLPVDTLANVVDLGKAAIGAPYTAITATGNVGATFTWYSDADLKVFTEAGLYKK